MDALDCEILRILRDHGRISYRALAERVHLSPNAAGERVRRLVADGVIRDFAARVDPAAVGRPLVAIIDIRLKPGVAMADAEEAIRKLPQLLIAAHVTGRSDYILHVACRDRTDMDALITAVNDEVGASETETRLLLREIWPLEPPF